MAGGDGTHAADREWSGADETLVRESPRSRVTRVRLRSGGLVIRKRPVGPDAARRLRHETAILTRLAGLDDVPRLYEGDGPADSVVMVDTGGVALADLLPMDPGRVLPLALDLARVVAGVHGRGVMHKDINPANVILSGAPARPALVDFGLAVTFAEDRPEFTHQNEMVGTLPYLAPEQTGRTGRPVDQRADLYALGATLYELATGRPPFGTGEPLRLIHDHLARVPAPPQLSNAAVPPGLSEVILRLLEKEPDQRYQSADGLAYDLSRVIELGRPLDLLGERDFPSRLVPPSRLVGRDREVTALREAFAAACGGSAGVVLVSGAPGTGKTALTDELRAVAAAAGGWFVTGKFDQYRQDQDSDAVRQAFRALGRLLLAEPAAELDRLRPHILQALGANAGLITAVLPEFALLLGDQPEFVETEPTRTAQRLAQAALDLLRAIGSPQRPVALVIDDLQWAAATPIGLFDVVQSDPDLRGVLLVGTYREAEVDSTHPLGALLTRWTELGIAATRIRLANLPPDDLTTLLADMLRLPPTGAAALAGLVALRTGGNPFDTVELVNALRRDGGLVLGPDGWLWDAAEVRRFLGDGAVVDLVAARIDELPGPTQRVLGIMGCLGGEVRLDLLRAATGLDSRSLADQLRFAYEDGLVVREAGAGAAVRFRHDRVQQVAHARLSGAGRDIHLGLARRLAAAGHTIAAAEQYLPALDIVGDPDERRQVVGLFRAAAANARLMTNHAVVERFLTAAISVLDAEGTDDPDGRLDLELDRHVARYHLGRLGDADVSYRLITDLRPGPLPLARAAETQVSSLTNRGLCAEAVALGRDVLHRLGHGVPGDDELGASFGPLLAGLDAWPATDPDAVDGARPEITDERTLAVVGLINRMLPPAYFSRPVVMAWLVLESGRLWVTHDPAAALVGPLSHAAFVTCALRADYRTGRQVVRHVLAVSAARGYEPGRFQAQFLYALGTVAWFESPAECIRQAHEARDGLVRGGDLQNACYTYFASLPHSVDCAPTLDDCAAEVESALRFAALTGNAHAAGVFGAFQTLVTALRGAPVERVEPPYREDDLTAVANDSAARALVAAIFSRPADVVRYAARGFAVWESVQNTYPTLNLHLWRALAAAHEVRAAGPDDHRPALETLDRCREWLAARAADNPDSYRHLVHLVDAERAWALDDFRAAARAFDAARREVQDRDRPWHRPYIAERAARFHLDNGLDHGGRVLLAEARHGYGVWGAAAKVDALDAEFPFLAAGSGPGERPVPVPVGSPADAAHRRTRMSTDTIDLLGILDAARVLSSETTVDRLRTRVVDVLSVLTGATAVGMVLRDDDGQGWHLPAPDDGDGTGRPHVATADAVSLVPLSAVRVVERTREPLVVDDATGDHRFSRDPYFRGVDRCSLLVVPIVARGVPLAIVVLENRLSRRAFTADRIDAVMLVAGQLAVSLDNALVYASLERKVKERTADLALANERLRAASLTDPLTGLANRRRLLEVLHTEWARAQRSRTPVAVAIVDIDHFKLYNDHYGHLAGDRCIRRVAEVLVQGVRSGTDLAARYGGEEFVLVLSGAAVANAHRVAERIRAAVEALAEPHEPSPSGLVTVSIGVCAATVDEGSSPDKVLAAADARLYTAKRGGRNQVAGHALLSR
ncbi:AAA family ATPase [Virgisporangium ochraceum]